MSDPVYQQFKLFSGEEVVCEVLEWQSVHDDDAFDFVVVTNAYSLVAEVNLQENIRYYAFKPFMMYQERPGQQVTINASHITSMAEPNPYIVKQWLEFMRKVNELLDEQEPDPIDKRIDQLDELVASLRDSDEMAENVIDFRKKLH